MPKWHVCANIAKAHSINAFCTQSSCTSILPRRRTHVNLIRTNLDGGLVDQLYVAMKNTIRAAVQIKQATKLYEGINDPAAINIIYTSMKYAVSIIGSQAPFAPGETRPK